MEKKIFEILKGNGLMPSGAGADIVAANITSYSDCVVVEAVTGVLNYEFLKDKFGNSSLSGCIQKVLNENGVVCSIDADNPNFVIASK